VSRIFKAGQKVVCSEVPGKIFTIVEGIGEDEVTQYMLKDKDESYYGYVLADSLKEIK
jgi:hypothetical protein